MSSLHERAKEVFLAALERPAGDRRSFVAEACAGDGDLLQEVESLLAFHEDGTGGAGAPESEEPADPQFSTGEVIAGRSARSCGSGRR